MQQQTWFLPVISESFPWDFWYHICTGTNKLLQEPAKELDEREKGKKSDKENRNDESAVGRVVPGKFMVEKSKIPEMRVTGVTGRGKGVMKEIKSSYFGKKRLRVEGAPMKEEAF